MENILFTIFDIFNFGWVAFLWWFTIRNYNTLPEKIPVHMDLDENPDRFGRRIYAFLMPVLATVFYVVFTYATRHPEGTNFPVEITDQNRHAQFLIMKIFMRVLFAFLMLMFINNQDYMIRRSTDESAKPKISIATTILSVIAFLPILLVIINLFK